MPEAKLVDQEGAGVAPEDETALRRGAGVEQPTAKPNEAYARFDRPVTGPYREGDLPSGPGCP